MPKIIKCAKTLMQTIITINSTAKTTFSFTNCKKTRNNNAFIHLAYIYGIVNYYYYYYIMTRNAQSNFGSIFGTMSTIDL